MVTRVTRVFAAQNPQICIKEFELDCCYKNQDSGSSPYQNQDHSCWPSPSLGTTVGVSVWSGMFALIIGTCLIVSDQALPGWLRLKYRARPGSLGQSLAAAGLLCGLVTVGCC